MFGSYPVFFLGCGGWLDQMEIKITSATLAWAELGNNVYIVTIRTIVISDIAIAKQINT